MATIKIRPILEAKFADPRIRERLIARLERNIQRTADTGCWLWTGAKNNSGYGKLCLRHRGQLVQVYAHRLMWTMANCRDVPSHLVLDHTCRTRRCCNPKHTEPRKPSTNTRLGYAMRRAEAMAEVAP